MTQDNFQLWKSQIQGVLLKWWRTINNPTTQIHLSWMKRKIHSQCEFNTKSLQKYVQLKTLWKKPLKQLKFFFKELFSMMANLSSHVKLFKKITLQINATNHDVKSTNFSPCAPHMSISSFTVVHFSLLPLSLLFFF